MEGARFLSLLAASIGFVGALFLSKGVVILDPKMMLQLTSPHSKRAYAPKQIASMASQKADAVIGIFCICGAFAIQVFSNIIPSESEKLFSSPLKGFWVAMVMVLILTIVCTLFNSSLRNRYRREIGEEALRHYFDNSFRRAVNSLDVNLLETMTQDLLKIAKAENETQVQFIRRIAGMVGWEIPEECDLSRIDNDNTR